MASQKEIDTDQFDRPKAHRAELVGLARPTSEHMGATELYDRMFETSHYESPKGQESRLADPQLQSAQRRTIAVQIGQTQGNRHLQRQLGSHIRRQSIGAAAGLSSTAGASDQPDAIAYDTVKVVLNAIMDILDGFGDVEVREEVNPGELGPNLAHPATHPEVPEEYRSILWDFWKAAQGQEEDSKGWVQARGRRRRFWIENGMRRIQMLVLLAIRHASEAATILDERIQSPAATILR